MPTPAKRRSWSAATSFERTRRRPLGRRTSIRQTPRRSSARGRDEVDPGVGIVDPVHGDLADAQSEPLRGHEQLGVEEPLVVLDERQQLLSRVPSQRLETALGVAEAAAQRELEQQVVGPRDQLALGTPHDVRAPRQPRADGDVPVARQQRRHQRQQRRQGGGEVHVHVGDHRGVAGRPRRTQRVAAALAGQVQSGHAAHGRGQRSATCIGVVGAGVVDDRDERPEGEGLVEERAQRGDALCQLRRLVVDRHDDLDVHGEAARVDVGLVRGQGCHDLHGAGAGLRPP